MHLIGVKEDNGWLSSRWELTYPTGWNGILNGVRSAYRYFDQPEILVNSDPVRIDSEEDISRIPESGNMTLRGLSQLIKAPVSIRLYNQLSAVDVTVAQSTDEFKKADYEQFNHSMCQFLDSFELAMHS